jgi:hypothetical protein
MLVATFVATLFIPLFYVLLRRREAKPVTETPAMLVEKPA